jgi:hypothetical protein
MENVKQFDNDKATKILLEMYFLRETFKSIDLKKEDTKEAQKKMKSIEKTFSTLEKDLNEIFKIEINSNTKKMYLKLKDGDFGKELLEVAKYLE